MNAIVFKKLERTARWAAALCLACWSIAQVAASPGTIRVLTDHHGISRVGEEITVVLMIEDYTDNVEIDGFNLVVNYDASLLALVAGSFSLGDASGTGQQWLSKPNQEPTGFNPAVLNNLTTPGKFHISVADLGYNPTESGTVAQSGVLATFRLQVVGEGTSKVNLEPLGGSILFDTTLAPAGQPQLIGTKKIRTKRAH